MTGSPAVTLGQLLDLDLLNHHEVLGGAAGLGRPVRMVVAGSAVHEVSELAPGSVVVFGREQLALDDLAVDLAIRLAGSAGLSGIIAARTSRQVPFATRRLADRLALPLVGVEDIAPAGVVAAFDPYVRAPEMAGLRVLGDAARHFQRPPANANALTSLLAATLGEPVALVDAEARFVAGDPAVHALLGTRATAQELGDPHPVAVTFETDGDGLLAQPVQVDPAGPAAYWIVVRRPRFATGVLLEPVRRAVAIAALSFAVHVASEAVRAEREHRRRSLLLNEILEQPDDPGRRTVERATALGWRLAGWHTAVHVQVSDAPPALRASALGAELEEQLAEHGVPAAVVERAEGWVFWSTTEAEATEADPGPLTERLTRTLAALEAEHPGLRLCAGMGAPHAGTAGIGRSVDQARQATLLARTTHRPAAVEHFDAVSTRRLLAGWYGSAPLRGAAADLLAPLAEADPSGELVRTLRCYLDCQSSAKAAGVLLGVHRNTVMQRMERVTELLQADLGDPDDRLAVHLAARAVDVEWDDPPDGPHKGDGSGFGHGAR
ncbi:helix-turn-helix domain-containing protein [Amycolatopsis thermalba]|uniref:Helix-turn-helix domain-containing protein n=1 Tax=Amycolatopsis thermalba TaxID=944492 RepID=A0ABY4P0U7_9PSEU|nr:PucR family transcriptional regulator [Amycolatopsis thermalba]UQS25965.1 helix-turn-helix domain-containing protein [Amycolatopsis thermalba]